MSQKYIGKLTLLVQSKEELTDCKDGDTLINPGPNFAWHADGYDKLKPYGFPTHGCIDGFSRRFIWLKVSRTNNDPAVVAGFFFEAVQSAGGCPTILRTDNVIMEQKTPLWHLFKAIFGQTVKMNMQVFFKANYLSRKYHLQHHFS